MLVILCRQCHPVTSCLAAPRDLFNAGLHSSIASIDSLALVSTEDASTGVIASRCLELWAESHVPHLVGLKYKSHSPIDTEKLSRGRPSQPRRTQAGNKWVGKLDILLWSLAWMLLLLLPLEVECVYLMTDVYHDASRLGY